MVKTTNQNMAEQLRARIRKLSVNETQNWNLIRKAKRELRKYTDTET